MSDMLIKSLLFNGSVKLTAISGKGLVDEARRAHGMSHVCTAALGRLLMQTAMMSAGLKIDTESITAVLDGDGAGGRFVAVGSPDCSVKGYADFPTVELPLKENGKLDVSGVVGTNGEIRVIRDLAMREPYVGRCPLTDGEIANDFAHYYLTSEQQPSLVYLGVRIDSETSFVRSAAGMLLQPLPHCSDEDITVMENAAGSISELAARLDSGETLEYAVSSILTGMDIEITEKVVPAFKCDCNRDRIDRALISLGREELQDMLDKDHGAELTCRFCGKVYRYTEQELFELCKAVGALPIPTEGDTH